MLCAFPLGHHHHHTHDNNNNNNTTRRKALFIGRILSSSLGSGLLLLFSLLPPPLQFASVTFVQGFVAHSTMSSSSSSSMSGRYDDPGNHPSTGDFFTTSASSASSSSSSGIPGWSRATRPWTAYSSKTRWRAASAVPNLEPPTHLFHDYDRPLVLLGCSGAGRELDRLASALLTQYLSPSASTAQRVLDQLATDTTTSRPDSVPTAEGGGIIRVSGLDAQGLYVLTVDDLLRSIQTQRYRWPDLVVLDLDDALFSSPALTEADVALLERHYQQVAQALYEQAGLLSIFVHVDGANSQMSPAARQRQARLTDTVFRRYSDYELCIRHEGLDPMALLAQELVHNQNTTSSSSSSSTDSAPPEKGVDEPDLLLSSMTTADVLSSPTWMPRLQELTVRQQAAWDHVEWELARLVARARLIPAVPGDQSRLLNTAHLTMGSHTFFLSLSFPKISHMEPYAAAMCADVDAMEYRVDLLAARDDPFEILYGLQLLRQYCRPHVVRNPALPLAGTMLEDVMPVVYTVRTQHQAGTYPDDEAGINSMFELLELGLRGGVEVLDVESAWDPAKTQQLLDRARARYSSQILGSHHVVGRETSLEEAVMLYRQCALQGRAHGAKVVLSIDDDQKDRLAYEAALIAAELAANEGEPVIPHISLILGEVGQFSRVINIPFTPVTHESLPFKAAPGQMTSNEIMTTRLLTQIFQPKKYAILGHNIAYSVSPQMHGAAFAATKLPHQYVRVDVATVEEFIESPLFQADDFGGTSVTIPHKQAIIPYVHVLSEEARAIGSVNTLIVKQEYEDDGFKRVIYGDNTDWRGIYNPLRRLLGQGVDSVTDFALILGAGGTARAAAYVAAKLGLNLLYYNRTPSKALELTESFGGVVLTSLDHTDDDTGLADLLRNSETKRSLRVVISTLPAAANFVLPSWLVSGDVSVKPIVFDVNYKPYYTPLLVQAESSGCRVVRGSEMLWEQGVGQFELWTQRTAPYRIMKQVVLQNCQQQVPTSETTSSSTISAEPTATYDESSSTTVGAKSDHFN